MKKYLLPVLLMFISLPLTVFSQDLYWEDPVLAVPGNAGFSQTRVIGEEIYYFWQESGSESESSEIYISLAKSRDGAVWEKQERVLGPFSYTGSEIQFYSAAPDGSGEKGFLLAVSQPDNRVHIYRSVDGGKTFIQEAVTQALATRIMPRLGQTARGEMILFATQASEEEVSNTLGISYSHSADGSRWTDFTPLNPEDFFRGTFLPSHTSLGGREYVVFQSFTLGLVSSFQLYLRYSDDGGRTWSEPQFLTNFADPADGVGDNPFQYDNQRPSLTVIQGELILSWERSLSGQPSQIYWGTLNRDGSFKGRAEKVSRGNRSCEKPQAFFYNGSVYLLWFDNRAGDYHVILSRKTGLFWEDKDMTALLRGKSTFPSYQIYNGDLYLFWENQLSGRGAALVSLIPDRSVDPPVLRGGNFAEGRPVRQDDFVIRWNSPADSSGIAGYSYILSRDPEETPPRSLLTLDRNRVVELSVKEDGLWYFLLLAQDYAGNWSKTARMVINRDTTPPNPVTFKELKTDEQNLLLSNTGTISWNPPGDETAVAGYTWRLQYLGDYRSEIPAGTERLLQPPYQILGSRASYSFSNADNGLYALTVKAVDSAGNIGEPASIFFRMNKYVPVTFISRVDVQVDELGAYILALAGRGFSAGGEVQRVLLDLDKEPPYDLEFSLDSDMYDVETDRYISGPVLQDIYTGDYWVGVEHPLRGVHFSRNPVTLTAMGTVKFGDFQAGKGSSWKSGTRARWTISVNTLLIVFLLCFLALMMIFTIRRLALLVQEGRALDREVRMLISGPVTLDETEIDKMELIRKKGRGLRFKFTLLVTILVLIIVTMVALPLAVITSNRQQEILAKGLEQRAAVLLESLTSGARAYLPVENLLELGNLPAQMAAMGEDALFVTVTGRGRASAENLDPDSFDYVWATNDPAVLQGERLEYGQIKAEDVISPLLPGLAASLEEEAASRVADISMEIARLNEQTAPLVAEFIRTQNPETEEAINAVQEQLRILDETLNKRLNEIGNKVFSVPEFNPQVLELQDTSYIFYKPILYRRSEDNTFFRGVVRLGVSTAGILGEIETSQKQLTLIIGSVAVAALILGILGALLLAAIIIRPINILVRGVEMIRDTEKKESLEGRPIRTKTHDELFILAETINEMTAGLIDAEKANTMLLGGKEVQKQFLPLDLLADQKNKATTGSLVTDNVSVFGYFEGALAVSGDYFDFRKIDEDHVVFIKCDVSGKGVPASLIAVQVASLYIRFFRDWEAKNAALLARGKKGLVIPDISLLVEQINDNLDYVGIARQGKFAALIVGILNQKTGVCQLCHAGDSLVHIYDTAKGMYTRELERLPAAGSFDPEMIRMRGGFPKAVQKLNPGDALILYTDGIEEAQRFFRDASYGEVVCDAPGIETGELHNGHRKGDNYEEFGNSRIHAIINEVMAGRNYRLIKYHSGGEEESLDFDFSAMEGTMENMVIVLAGIEKVFRIYLDPAAGARDIIRVDKKIDEFLKAHFAQYNNYFHHPVDRSTISDDDSPLYRYFSHLKEDHQFDDLTMLVVQKT